MKRLLLFYADPVDWFVFLKMETKKKIKGNARFLDGWF